MSNHCDQRKVIVFFFKLDNNAKQVMGCITFGGGIALLLYFKIK